MDGREPDGRGTDTDGCRTDVALAEMAEPDDAAVLDVDECTELVRLAEAVIPAPGVEIVEHVRWRLVVVGEARLERQLGESLDRLGRDP